MTPVAGGKSGAASGAVAVATADPVGSNIEERNLRTAPNVREAAGWCSRAANCRACWSPPTVVSADAAARDGTSGPANGLRPAHRADDAVEQRLAARPPLRLARLAPAPSQPVPLRRSTTIRSAGIIAAGIGWRLWPSYYGSNYWLQRSVAVSPAAGLRAVPLGPLLRRRVAGEHLHRRRWST